MPVPWFYTSVWLLSVNIMQEILTKSWCLCTMPTELWSVLTSALPIRVFYSQPAVPSACNWSGLLAARVTASVISIDYILYRMTRIGKAGPSCYCRLVAERQGCLARDDKAKLPPVVYFKYSFFPQERGRRWACYYHHSDNDDYYSYCREPICWSKHFFRG